jgi:hypothetical protein
MDKWKSLHNSKYCIKSHYKIDLQNPKEPTKYREYDTIIKTYIYDGKIIKG